MTLSIRECFAELLCRLMPTSVEEDARSRHRATIEQGLRGEFAAFNRLNVFGSHTRATAIHRHSDIDYLAVLGKPDVLRGGQWVRSSTTLGRVKTSLESRFPQTRVRIDGPAAIVEFRQGEGAVDVVPGVWDGMTATRPSRPFFWIPDGSDGWRQSSPDLHASYFREQDQTKALGKLARTVQLLKLWKFSRATAIPALGFHIEMLLASHDTCVGAKSYQNCLYDAFSLLAVRKGDSLQDPAGLRGLIPLANTLQQRKQVAHDASVAAEWCRKGILAECAGDSRSARDYWDMVFNGEFPAR